MFRLNRNERSHWSGNGVHVESNCAPAIGWNMQASKAQQAIAFESNRAVATRHLTPPALTLIPCRARFCATCSGRDRPVEE